MWAHRQALAARDAGAEVEVFVLHRPVPSKAALRARDLKALLAPLRQPLRTDARRDRGHLRAVRRAAAAALVRVAGARGRRRRSRSRCGAAASTSSTPTTPRPPATRCGARASTAPLVISVHGGDVLGVAERWRGGRAAVDARVRRRAAHARELARRSPSAAARSAPTTCASCTSAPTSRRRAHRRGTTLVTVGNLIARKRHGDVLRALWLLRDEHPELHW